jgi:hypothetical protein
MSGLERFANVGELCTLPSDERPLRGEEFQTLFATAVVGLCRPEPGILDLLIESTAETTARDLAARETQCCSFFTFSFRPAERADHRWMRIQVGEAHLRILDEIATNAATAALPRMTVQAVSSRR